MLDFSSLLAPLEEFSIPFGVNFGRLQCLAVSCPPVMNVLTEPGAKKRFLREENKADDWLNSAAFAVYLTEPCGNYRAGSKNKYIYIQYTWKIKYI